MFCSSRADHTSTNFKKLLYLPIPSSDETWKIFKNMLCQFFFRVSWHFKREKHLYCKTRTDYSYIKLRVQDFATGKSFSFNQ